MPKPDYTSLSFPPAPPGRPYVIVNMVMSVDGKTVIEGSEAGIGSATDKRLMPELRVHCDIVASGAGTLRATGATSRLGDPALEQLRIQRGKPRFPIAAVVSRSGDLPLGRPFFRARDFEAVVYLSEAAPESARKATIATGRPVVMVPAGGELRAMLTHMREELRAELLLVEGGSDTNAGLLALGAVDELFLTLGPVIVGGRDTPTAVGGEPYRRDTAPRLELVHAIRNEETDELYMRYRVRR